MASNKYDDKSSEPSQGRQSNSDRLNRQESTIDQLERAVKECSRILQDQTGSSKGFPMKFSSSWSKPRRLPRSFFINDNKSILIILQGDITKTRVDAIVNAANQHMTGGSGVDGVIHSAAGNELYNACVAHKEVSRGVRLPTGHSRILLSYNMSHTTYHIINTAGPMYNRHDAKKCADQLRSCYKTALALADLYDLESIGFTAISCGIFGYPADDGADVALRSVDQYAASVPVVVFVLWDDHIYDAWIQKAEELKLKPYDPNSPSIATSSDSANGDDSETNTKNPTTKDDQQQSTTNFNPSVIDLSTPNTTDKKSEEEIEHLVDDLPSVPSDTSNTQNTQVMDQDDNSMNNDPPLTSQNTIEMASVNPAIDDSTKNADPEPPHTSEEANNSNDDKVTAEIIQNESQSPVVTNTSEDL